MRILILGGGRFLGRAFAAEGLDAGHQVTVFNRGKTSVDLPGTRVVRGDREDPSDLERLAGEGPWDAIVDTSGYVPKTVGDGARALAGAAGAYLFISSVSAFADYPGKPVGYGSRLFECAPDATEGEYGELKAGCERAVREAFPGRVLIHYPGIIIGPHESAGRSWWYTRIARGGDVLAPGDPDRGIQLIDARDVARFGLRCLESGAGVESGPGLESGTALESGADEADGLILAGPTGHTTFGAWLAACVAETGSDARLRWARDELLLEHEVAIWTGLPLWAPVRDDLAGTWSKDASRSLAAGLVCRPIEDTVRDTWAWLRDTPPLTDEDGRINGHGLSPADEQRILEALTKGS